MKISKLSKLEWLSFVVAIVVVVVTAAVIYYSYAVPKDRARITVPLLYQRAEMLNGISDPCQRDSMCIPLNAFARNLDMRLPLDTKLYLPGMLGKENPIKHGYYFSLQMYLHPRRIDISTDGKPRRCDGYYEGRDPKSDDELKQMGYHLLIAFDPKGKTDFRQLLPFPPVSDKDKNRKGHCPTDPLVALLVPLFVAIAGAGILKYMFRFTYAKMSLGEIFSSGLAIGCFMVGQLVFGLRLLGLRCERLIFWSLVLWSLFYLVQAGLEKKWEMPNLMALFSKSHYLLLVPLLILFFVLFKLAGLEGMLEFDAINAWMLKAKFIHFHAGQEMMDLFMNSRYGYAHADYPITVPALHAFTFGVIGHPNTFVTKFWPAWMLFALSWHVLSASDFHRGGRSILALGFVIMLTHMPIMFQHVRGEGGTVPMLFFCFVGMVHCVIALKENDSNRLLLGLFFVFCQAFVKHEGKIVIAGLPLLLLLFPSTRRMLASIARKRWLLVGAVAMLFALPYLYLAANMPKLYEEADWVGLMCDAPGKTVHLFKTVICLMIVKRFVNGNLASWYSPDNVNIEWRGRWDGFSSLVNEHTWGIMWMFLLVFAMVILIRRQARLAALVTTLVVAGQLVIVTLIMCSWTGMQTDMKRVINATGAIHFGRILFPFMITWGLCMVVLFFRRDRKKPEISE